MFFPFTLWCFKAQKQRDKCFKNPFCFDSLPGAHTEPKYKLNFFFPASLSEVYTLYAENLINIISFLCSH